MTSETRNSIDSNFNFYCVTLFPNITNSQKFTKIVIFRDEPGPADRGSLKPGSGPAGSDNDHCK